MSGTDVVVANLAPAVNDINRRLEDYGVQAAVDVVQDGSRVTVVAVHGDAVGGSVPLTEPMSVGRVGEALGLMVATLDLLEG